MIQSTNKELLIHFADMVNNYYIKGFLKMKVESATFNVTIHYQNDDYDNFKRILREVIQAQLSVCELEEVINASCPSNVTAHVKELTDNNIYLLLIKNLQCSI